MRCSTAMGSENFSSDGVSTTGTKATISSNDNNDEPWLAPNTTYEVRVRADNGERDSAWSGTGNGRTNRANHEPIFDDRPVTGTGSNRNSTDGFTIWRTMDENPRSGHVVGRVFAEDADNDRLTYKLVASDATDGARQEVSNVHHQTRLQERYERMRGRPITTRL